MDLRRHGHAVHRNAQQIGTDQRNVARLTVCPIGLFFSVAKLHRPLSISLCVPESVIVVLRGSKNKLSVHRVRLAHSSGIAAVQFLSQSFIPHIVVETYELLFVEDGYASERRSKSTVIDVIYSPSSNETECNSPSLSDRYQLCQDRSQGSLNVELSPRHIHTMVPAESGWMRS
ncbi:hypothetical protein GALMADRAFT_1170568 [Galerina marginata CBS 339.88]|uniref:Uncharacterized protein n=1 Tax=Galerina marginata (strain CBS 339.88) TaxID=685588 RepID=A0A067TCA2_GALM3|nr:hypothetical protein GALMADRAFT_1170568 [Galerina marginata CBS 339.88]